MHALLKTNRFSVPMLCVSVGVGYFVLALLGIYATREAGNIAAIWPANGLILAVLLISPRRAWPVLIACCIPAIIAANLLFGDPLPVAISLAAGNVLEVSVAIYLLSRFDESTELLGDLTSILRFVAYCVCIAPVFGAIVGAGTINLAYGADFISVFPVWWASDALGYLLIVPLVGAGGIPRARLGEFAVLVLAGATLLAYGFSKDILAVLFPILPLMLWAAFRTGPTGTALLGLIVSGICITFTVRDPSVLAPIAGGTTVQQIIFIQFYLVTAVFAPFVISVVWRERSRMFETLRRNEAGLEEMAARSDSLRCEAEKANRFKSLFIAQVSHEFRTPLNAIKGFSQMLQREFHGPLGSDTNREYVDLIHWSGDHLLTVVEDLIAYSQIESGRYEIHPETIDPSGVVQEVCGLFGTKAETEKLMIDVDISRADGTVVADKKALRIALINLVGNAIKFTPAAGRISIAAYSDDEQYCIEVKDDGPGIAAEDQAKILEPFQRGVQTDPASKEGSGLGLCIVIGLMKLHGGKMLLESVPGQGSVFTLVFPRQ